MRTVTIGGRLIDDASLPYVIAELGHNHGGNLETARTLIQQAAAAGVDAVKTQKRDNQTLYSQALLDQPYENENSYGATYGAHREALEFNQPQYLFCRSVARAARVAFFATAFDEPSADFLDRLGVPAYKLASGSLTDACLLRHVASLGKPVILSTGGGTEADIDRAVNLIVPTNPQLALLHATASYPLAPAEANLRCILTLRSRYPDLVIGFSSHSPGLAFSLVAYAFGARIIEHHVTLNRASKGTDHAFSLEMKGLQTLVEDLRKLQQAMGDGVKVFYDSEAGPISKMRRRLTEAGMRITGERDE